MRTCNSLKGLAATIGCAVLLLAQSGQSQSTRTPWTGLTPEQLSAVYFQWVAGCPASSNPWFDTTGASVTAGQPYFTAPGGNGQLLFLPGTVLNGGTITLAVGVRQGTAFAVPLMLGEYDNTSALPRIGGTPSVAGAALGVPQMRAAIGAVLDTATGLYCTVTPADANFNPAGDPVHLSYARVYSAPFGYTLRNDNFWQVYFGVNIPSGRVAPAVADAYCTFIPGNTLTPGHYLLQFGGQMAFGGGVFAQAITYQVTVTP